MSLKYTLAFVRCGDCILMLYRYNPPNRSHFNGVGGKLIADETPRECVLREIREEAGIFLNDVRFAGIVTWDGAPETGAEGMYAYVAELDEMPIIDFDVEEGLLRWMTVEQVMQHNLTVDNIPHFLPWMLYDLPPQRWHCTYDGLFLHSVEQMPCPNLEGV